ncbi:hypothetical protein B0T18DRAFT_402726 [Schizothecium vesticola]|uniref:Uncharacterized protein n=1 Tax=Schizothecium vesticola TaxID=314040 RepID=A0AA40KAI6_9PEZI|nr:hypothetical protein B0T18DRAFT_402726 [Schizothecium vesticola]
MRVVVVEGAVGGMGGVGLVVVVVPVFGLVRGREEGHFAGGGVDGGVDGGGFRVVAGEDEDVCFFTLPPGPKPRMERRASPGIVSALRIVQTGLCVSSV